VEATDSPAAFTIFIFLVLPIIKLKAVSSSAGDICKRRKPLKLCKLEKCIQVVLGGGGGALHSKEKRRTQASKTISFHPLTSLDSRQVAASSIATAGVGTGTGTGAGTGTGTGTGAGTGAGEGGT
jgi:hypothetical protein